MAGGMIHEMREFFRRFLTPAVRAILFLNVGIFLFTVTILALFDPRDYFFKLFCQMPYLAVLRFQIWRFFTYMFLHADGMHLLFNMMALWFFAPRLEMRWGTKRFLKFYFICGVGAAVVHSIFTLLFGAKTPLSDGEAVRGVEYMIGASGAIYGILLAYALYWPDETVLLYFVIPMRIKYMVLLFGALEFIGSVNRAGSHISHITHLGGLLTAFLYLRGWTLFRSGFGRGLFAPRKPKRMIKRYYRDDDGRIYIEFDE